MWRNRWHGSPVPPCQVDLGCVSDDGAALGLTDLRSGRAGAGTVQVPCSPSPGSGGAGAPRLHDLDRRLAPNRGSRTVVPQALVALHADSPCARAGRRADRHPDGREPSLAILLQNLSQISLGSAPTPWRILPRLLDPDGHRLPRSKRSHSATCQETALDRPQGQCDGHPNPRNARRFEQNPPQGK